MEILEILVILFSIASIFSIFELILVTLPYYRLAKGEGTLISYIFAITIILYTILFFTY